MNLIEIAMQLQRKHIIIGAGIVFFGLWLCLVAYLYFGEKYQAPVTPGVVDVRSASPVATSNAPTVSVRAPRSSAAPLIHHSAPTYSYVSTSATPKASMSSTSMRIHQTSSASVKTIGGGGGGGIATTSGGSSGGRGIRYTSVSYSGAIYVPTTNNAVTAVGATQAGDVASQRIGAPRRATKTEDGEYPVDRPDPVEDEVYTPVGDVAWVLMLLLTIAWCVRVRLRKQ